MFGYMFVIVLCSGEGSGVKGLLTIQAQAKQWLADLFDG